MNSVIFTTVAPVFAVLAGWAIMYFLRHLAAQRREKSQLVDWEQMIASIRLRLPPGAEIVVLEHQMYFNDPRNREAATKVFQKNSFEVTATETYQKRTRYWLLAVRSAMIDRVPQEIQQVYGFVQSYGGRYEGLTSRI
jgi:hypothetical protein